MNNPHYAYPSWPPRLPNILKKGSFLHQIVGYSPLLPPPLHQSHHHHHHTKIYKFTTIDNYTRGTAYLVCGSFACELALDGIELLACECLVTLISNSS